MENKERIMLDMIYRIGKVCYGFCYTVGIILIVLGFLINISPDATVVFVFYYLFAVVFFIIGFLIKYVFCGNSQ